MDILQEIAGSCRKFKSGFRVNAVRIFRRNYRRRTEINDDKLIYNLNFPKIPANALQIRQFLAKLFTDFFDEFRR